MKKSANLGCIRPSGLLGGCLTSLAGMHVGHVMGLTVSLVVFPILMIPSACSTSGQFNNGVARVDEPSMAGTSSQPVGHSNPLSTPANQSTSQEEVSNHMSTYYQLTDEDIVTNFTVCMRDYGFNIPDPELNADGSINWGPLKEAISSDPEYQKRSNQAFDDCLPLLERFTDSGEDSKEDEIELQDKMLEFSQCLRDNGLDVSDPDFSGKSRASLKPIIAGLKGADSRVERIMGQCTEASFGAKEKSPKQ